MSTKDYITMLLDMEDVVLKNTEEDAQEIRIKIELVQKAYGLPIAKASHSAYHMQLTLQLI